MKAIADLLIDLPLVPSLLVKATLVLALAWLVHTMLARRNPRWRVLLWRGALGALVMLPVAEFTLPAIEVVLEARQPEQSVQPGAADVTTPPGMPSPAASPQQAGSLISQNKKNEEAVPAGGFTRHLVPLLSLMWIAGTTLLLGGMIASWLRVRAALQRARPASKLIEDFARESARALDVHRRFDVRVLDGLGSPFLTGTLRPVIVLPSRAAHDAEPDRLRAILAHELAHAKTHDPFWMTAARVVESVLWFHPLVWGVRSAHGAACEEVCDGVAAAHVGSAESYSRTLAREALALLSAQPAPGGVPMLRSAEIVRRLRKIQQGVRVSPLGRRRTSAVLATGAALTVLLGGLSLVEAQRERPGDDPSEYPHAIAVRTYVKQWSQFAPGDGIEILEVRGTTPSFEAGEHYYVRGRYTLESQDAALLHVYATNGEVASNQGPNVTRGEGEFVRTFMLVRLGEPHVSFYPVKGGDGFGGTYFRLGPDTPREQPPSRREMFEVEIKVVDERGRPVSNARIVPDGLRARATMSGHYSWMEDRHGPPVTAYTDDAGVTRVPYPRYVEEQRSTGAISFTVTHPDFVGLRPHSFRVDGGEPPLTLVRGGRVRVTGLLEAAPVPPDRLWVQLSSHEVWYDDTSWSVDGDALVLNQAISAKPHMVQAAYMPAGGPLHVSDAQTIDARMGEIYDIRLELKEAARLEGRLDRSIPRPIQNGRVVIMLSPAFHTPDAGTMFWETWRDVNPDGSFVFESLPPGRVEITALCDGYRSHDGAPREGSFVHPQVRTLSRGTNQCEIAMTPTATCEVTVLKPDGSPLQGAEVRFWPNTKWHIGTTVFAQRRVRWEEFVPGVGQLDALPPELFAFQSTDFRATTDENGVARVVNLVDGRQDFAVVHDEFSNPSQPDVTPARRVATVELIAGQTASTSVTMEPVGATTLDGNNGEVAILGADATSQVAQQQPETEIQPKTPIVTWRTRFDEVYRLTDDQLLKRIPPPFIAEREQYYQAEHSSQAEAISNPPDYFMFHWDTELKNWGLGFGHSLSVSGVITSILRINKGRFEGPEDVLSLEMPGDWIVRTTADEQSQLNVLADIARRDFNTNVRFESRSETRTVVVVSGDYAFTPLPSAPVSPDSIHLVADEFNDGSGGGGGTGTFNQFLDRLANVTGVRFLDESSKPTPEKVTWRNHRSAEIAGDSVSEQEKRARLERVLENLHFQTGLDYTIQEREVELWIAVGNK